jgi:hypothetical protein
VAQKKIQTRIQLKHDLEANWQKAVNFVPLAGELIIYDKEVDSSGNITKPERIKIGDGVSNVNDLSFCVSQIAVITIPELDAICVIPVEAGLYQDGGMTMSWDELMEDGMFVSGALEGGYLMSVYGYTPIFTDGELVISDVVTSIGGVGDYFTKVTIPDSVTSIDGGAFGGNVKLVEVVLPNSITTISGFNDCSSLSIIDLPNSVTEIGPNAFKNCTSLPNIIIPENVARIRENAFEGCTGITSITIPASITDIGAFAFKDCTALSEIVFEGTIAQWQSVSCDVVWNLNVPATQVICSDGTITL